VQEYRRRKERTRVTAVCLDLDTEGFTYRKWGGTQRCKKGDSIVNSNSDAYTIDAETFQRTYRMVCPGLYEKIGSVWAEMASEGDAIQTKEGSTAYRKGDFLVFNDPAGKDGYAMSPARFHELYESER
jgi:hypothetical protein